MSMESDLVTLLKTICTEPSGRYAGRYSRTVHHITAGDWRRIASLCRRIGG